MREILTLVTGVQPTSATIDPETAVALGAAILSSIMDNQMMDMQAKQKTQATKPVGFKSVTREKIAKASKQQKADQLCYKLALLVVTSSLSPLDHGAECQPLHFSMP